MISAPRSTRSRALPRATDLGLVVVTAFAAVLSAAPCQAEAPPPRIVSANIASDEILIALAPERLVAVSVLVGNPEVSNVTEVAAKLPVRVGADVEAIVALRPDVVAIGGQASPIAAQLESLGIRVVRVQGFESIAWVENLIRALGEAAGVPARADRMIAAMRTRLAAVRERVAVRPRPRVLTYSAAGTTAGRDTLLDEMIHTAGGVNVAAEIGVSGFKRVSLERVLAADPDLILLRTMRRWAPGFAVELAQHPALRSMRAVTTGRVHEIPGRLIVAASQHIATAVEALADVLHPDTVPGRAPSR